MPSRRSILIGAASEPVLGGLGCKPTRTALHAEERDLVAALSPWESLNQREEFADGFLSDGSYSSHSAEVVRSLARKVVANRERLEVVQLSQLTDEEREALSEMTEQIYSVLPVLLCVRGALPLGVCTGLDWLGNPP